jgi:tRNA pseudouridine38-40 synthase
VTSSETTEPAAPSGSGGLSRLRLDIRYDGTDFSGWAAQPGRRTVEQTLADALATVLRLPDPPRLVVAGRTDAGVHALGQVAHVDVPSELSDRGVAIATSASDTSAGNLARRLAGVLPPDVVVTSVVVAPDGFDARFSALARHYRYRITDAAADPLRRRDTLAWPRPLDAAAMAAAGNGLLGEHDFAAYCRPREGGSTIRRLLALDVRREGDVVVVSVSADAFCHNQVRSMVGALLAVGEGRRPIDWPAEVLARGVRDSAVTVAPPHGLTLVAVDYPPDAQLAARASVTRQRR